MIKLTTDLRSLCITPEGGETTSFLYACYTRDCPLPKWAQGLPHGLAPYTLPLRTHVIDARVKQIEPGVFYRLPEATCNLLGSCEDLSLIPLNVEVHHVPYVDFIEDDHGRSYVPNLAADIDCRAVHTTRLYYGSWVVCGLLQTEQARAWASLDDVEWCIHSTFNRAHKGLDASWQPLRQHTRTTIAFDQPLLNSAVEVSRETA